MSCCAKESKRKVKEPCCETKPDDQLKVAEDSTESRCCCEGSKQTGPKKDEKKEASCC